MKAQKVVWLMEVLEKAINVMESKLKLNFLEASENNWFLMTGD